MNRVCYDTHQRSEDHATWKSGLITLNRELFVVLEDGYGDARITVQNIAPHRKVENLAQRVGSVL